MSETPTLIERLEDQGCDRMPFTDEHKHCICRLTNEAAREITSLRAQLDEARRKAIDDAAQVADEYALKVRSLMRGVPSVEEGTAQSIAKLIRALLSESKT